jgi:putative ABC transport system permease protein
MDSPWLDLRYAVRGLRRAPGFSCIVILTLALGIGGTTAIFSVVNAVLLRPLPFPQGERLVWLGESFAKANGISVTWVNFQRWRDANHTLEALAAFQRTQLTWTGRQETRLLRAGLVSDRFFGLLGAQPMMGRLLTADDDRAGAEPVIVISHEFWTTQLANDPRALETSLTLDGVAYHIVGVTPAGWRFFETPVDGYLPLGPRQRATMRRDAHGSIRAVGRIAAGRTVQNVCDDLDDIMRRLAVEDPGPEDAHRAEVQLLAGRDAREARPMLLTLMAAVGVMLLIACVNVANLVLARSATRARELAIRAAIGAGRLRIARQLLTEQLLLATLGGLAGVALAYWGVALLAHAGPIGIPRLADVRIDPLVLAFAAGVTLFTAVAVGLVPFVTAGRLDLLPALNEGARSAGQPGRAQRLARTLVVAEIAMTLMLAFACALLVRSLIAAQTRDPGFAAGQVLALEIAAPSPKYAAPARSREYFDRLTTALAALPGVTAVGAVNCPPSAGGCMDWFYSVLDRPAPTQGDVPIAYFNRATPSYFQTMRIPLLQGRNFSDRDREDAPGVAIVNDAFARRWWGSAPAAVGQRVKVGGPYQPGPELEIVGVVGDVSQQSLASLAGPEIYRPFAQWPSAGMAIMLRTADASAAAAPAAATLGSTPAMPVSMSMVRTAVAAIDPDVPIQRLRLLEQALGETLDARRFGTALLTLFGIVALLLAFVGVYGLLSGWVAAREGDIAIRMALGADRRTIATLVGFEALRLCLLGLLLGTLGGLATSRLLEGLLFTVSARSPLALALALLAVITTATAAAALPLWRATRVDAIRTLVHA